MKKAHLHFTDYMLQEGHNLYISRAGSEDTVPVASSRSLQRRTAGYQKFRIVVRNDCNQLIAQVNVNLELEDSETVFTYYKCQAVWEWRVIYTQDAPDTEVARAKGIAALYGRYASSLAIGNAPQFQCYLVNAWRNQENGPTLTSNPYAWRIKGE